MPLWVDRVEHVLAKTFEWSKVHRNVVQAAFGWSLLFYSSHFSNVAMLGHSLASAGLPIIQMHARHLVQTYQRTREAIKEESPALIAETKHMAEYVKKLSDLKAELSKAKRDFEKGKISPSEWAALSKDIRNEMATISNSLDLLKSSLTVISKAVDPHHLHIIGLHLYGSVMSHIAATSSHTAKSITLGLSVGHVVGNKATNIITSFMKKSSVTNAQQSHISENDVNKWTHYIIHGGVRVLSIAASFMLARFSHIFSDCMLGAHMLLLAAEDILYPVLNKMNLPIIIKDPQVFTVIQMALVGVGFISQMRGLQVPLLFRPILIPLKAADMAITAIFVVNKVAKS